MFKRLLVICSLLISSAVLAEEPRHMIMFGNDFGTGWSGGAARAKVDSDLGIDKFDLGKGNFAVNYAYRVAPQFQVGLGLSNELETQDLKAKNGNKVKSEKKSSSFTIF